MSCDVNIRSNALRIDKFLWCIRFFKTRSIASKACSSGKIKCNGRALKSSYIVKLGDVYIINGKEIEVISIPKTRASLDVSKLYYKIIKEDINIGSNNNLNCNKGIRPTKKQRRALTKFLQK